MKGLILISGKKHTYWDRTTTNKNILKTATKVVRAIKRNNKVKTDAKKQKPKKDQKDRTSGKTLKYKEPANIRFTRIIGTKKRNNSSRIMSTSGRKHSEQLEQRGTERHMA